MNTLARDNCLAVSADPVSLPLDGIGAARQLSRFRDCPGKEVGGWMEFSKTCSHYRMSQAGSSLVSAGVMTSFQSTAIALFFVILSCVNMCYTYMGRLLHMLHVQGVPLSLHHLWFWVMTGLHWIDHSSSKGGLSYSNRRQCCGELSGEHFGCRIGIPGLAGRQMGRLGVGDACSWNPTGVRVLGDSRVRSCSDRIASHM